MTDQHDTDDLAARSPVRWLPAGLPDIAADPKNRPLGELVAAYSALTAGSGALGDLAQRVRGEIVAQAAAERDRLGAGSKWRGVEVPDVGSAYDAFRRRQFVVAEAERAAAWLAGHDPDGYDQCVVETETVVIASQAAAAAAIVQQDGAALLDAVAVEVDTTVDVAALVGLDGYTVAGHNVITTDGEVVPGVTVTPARFKNVTVTPDKAHTAGMRRLFTAAVLAGAGDTTDRTDT